MHEAVAETRVGKVHEAGDRVRLQVVVLLERVERRLRIAAVARADDGRRIHRVRHREARLEDRELLAHDRVRVVESRIRLAAPTRNRRAGHLRVVRVEQELARVRVVRVVADELVRVVTQSEVDGQLVRRLPVVVDRDRTEVRRRVVEARVLTVADDEVTARAASARGACRHDGCRTVVRPAGGDEVRAGRVRLRVVRVVPRTGVARRRKRRSAGVAVALAAAEVARVHEHRVLLAGTEPLVRRVRAVHARRRVVALDRQQVLVVQLVRVLRAEPVRVAADLVVERSVDAGRETVEVRIRRVRIVLEPVGVVRVAVHAQIRGRTEVVLVLQLEDPLVDQQGVFHIRIDRRAQRAAARRIGIERRLRADQHVRRRDHRAQRRAGVPVLILVARRSVADRVEVSGSAEIVRGVVSVALKAGCIPQELHVVAVAALLRNAEVQVHDVVALLVTRQERRRVVRREREDRGARAEQIRVSAHRPRRSVRRVARRRSGDRLARARLERRAPIPGQ